MARPCWGAVPAVHIGVVLGLLVVILLVILVVVVVVLLLLLFVGEPGVAAPVVARAGGKGGGRGAAGGGGRRSPRKPGLPGCTFPHATAMPSVAVDVASHLLAVGDVVGILDVACATPSFRLRRGLPHTLRHSRSRRPAGDSSGRCYRGNRAEAGSRAAGTGDRQGDHDRGSRPPARAPRPARRISGGGSGECRRQCCIRTRSRRSGGGGRGGKRDGERLPGCGPLRGSGAAACGAAACGVARARARAPRGRAVSLCLGLQRRRRGRQGSCSSCRCRARGRWQWKGCERRGCRGQVSDCGVSDRG